MKFVSFVDNSINIYERSKDMSFNMNRINPNQTQVIFHDGRFETLTNEELDDFLLQMGISEVNSAMEQDVTD
jgi:hypothetical protein